MVGVLKAAEKRSTFSPDNKPETRQLLWAEKASLLQAAGLTFNDGAPDAGAYSVPILVEAVGEFFFFVLTLAFSIPKHPWEPAVTKPRAHSTPLKKKHEAWYR